MSRPPHLKRRSVSALAKSSTCLLTIVRCFLISKRSTDPMADLTAGPVLFTVGNRNAAMDVQPSWTPLPSLDEMIVDESATAVSTVLNYYQYRQDKEKEKAQELAAFNGGVVVPQYNFDFGISGTSAGHNLSHFKYFNEGQAHSKTSLARPPQGLDSPYAMFASTASAASSQPSSESSDEMSTSTSTSSSESAATDYPSDLADSTPASPSPASPDVPPEPAPPALSETKDPIESVIGGANATAKAPPLSQQSVDSIHQASTAATVPVWPDAPVSPSNSTPTTSDTASASSTAHQSNEHATKPAAKAADESTDPPLPSFDAVAQYQKSGSFSPMNSGGRGLYSEPATQPTASLSSAPMNTWAKDSYSHSTSTYEPVYASPRDIDKYYVSDKRTKGSSNTQYSKSNGGRGAASPGSPSGLANLGNTCYANSVLQGLAGLPSFVEALKRMKPSVPMFEAFQKLILAITNGQQTYRHDSNSKLLQRFIREFNTHFKHRQHFRKLRTPEFQIDGNQQDSSGFFLNLMNAFNDEDESKELAELFCLREVNTKTCQACRGLFSVNQTVDENYAVILWTDELVRDQVNRRYETSTFPLNCPHGCGKQSFVERLETYNPPANLCLFANLESGSKPPSTSPVIRLGEFVYRLVSVVRHHGPSVNFGHFIAWVKLPTGSWVSCNDSSITDQKNQRPPNGFLFFYALKTEPLQQQVLPPAVPPVTTSAFSTPVPPAPTPPAAKSLRSSQTIKQSAQSPAPPTYIPNLYNAPPGYDLEKQSSAPIAAAAAVVAPSNHDFTEDRYRLMVVVVACGVIGIVIVLVLTQIQL